MKIKEFFGSKRVWTIIGTGIGAMFMQLFEMVTKG